MGRTPETVLGVERREGEEEKKEDEEREKERERKRGELREREGGEEERKKRGVVLNGTLFRSCIRYEGRRDNTVLGLGKCANVSCCCGALSA